MGNIVKSKYWTTEIYLDSTPNENVVFQKFLDYHLKFIVSPLHNMDKYDNGENKKAHKHILILFDSPKSLNQVENLISQTTCVGCIQIENLIGYYEYLWHKNEIDKYQYDKDLKYFNCSEYDIYRMELMLNDIINIILDNNIKSLRELYYMFRENQYSKEFYKTISHYAYMLKCLCNENLNKE